MRDTGSVHIASTGDNAMHVRFRIIPYALLRQRYYARRMFSSCGILIWR